MNLYARFIDIRSDYYYPGIIDHYPEGAIVAYALTLNAVYNVRGYEGDLVKISSRDRVVFETETIMEKGSLAQRLCSPFDAAGHSLEQLIDPNALCCWIPEVGDEVFIDEEPAVIVARKGENGLGDVNVLEEFKKPVPANAFPGNRGFNFSKNSSSTLQGVNNRTAWGFGMKLKYFVIPAPVYGESFGGALSEYSFDPEKYRYCDIENREECYKRIIPVFGRDKIDMCFREGKIGFYRQHYGFRGCCSFKCIKGIGALKTDNHYTVDCVNAKVAVKVPVWDDTAKVYRAFNLDRFELPQMLR